MACEFNGTNQSLTVSNNSAVQLGGGDFAFSVLVRPAFNPTAGSYQTIFSIGQYDNGILLRSQPSGTSSNDNFYVNNTYYDWAPYLRLANGVWTAIAVSRIGSTVRLYADGTEYLSVTNSTNISQSTDFNIGRSTHNLLEYWTGSMADIALWKGAGLTAAEVQSLARGFTADQVRPQSLSFYTPLVRDLQDVRGGLAITNNNGATVATHPRIIT